MIAIPTLMLLFAFAYKVWTGAIAVHFFVPLFLFLFLAFIPVKWANKQVAGQHSRTKRFLLQYAFALTIACVFALVTGDLNWDSRIPLVLMVGILQSFGTYAQWKSAEISLSKSSLFTFLDDFIAMGLSAVFLHEFEMLTPLTWTGVVICMGVVFYFFRENLCLTKTKVEVKIQLVGSARIAELERLSKSPAFFGYILFYSGAWGIAMFCARYFSFQDLTPGHFAISWYGGAFITANFIYWFYRDPSASQQLKAGKDKWAAHDVIFMFYYASGIVVCLMLGYAVHHTTPQNISQPLILIGEAVGGAWVGWKFFKEGHQFSYSERIAAVIGLCGIMLIGYATYTKV